MENREAIEILQFYTELADPELRGALDLAISALKEQEEDRWIPVKECEPTETGSYLVTETVCVERKWTTRMRVARCEVTELNDGRIDVCWRG